MKAQVFNCLKYSVGYISATICYSQWHRDKRISNVPMTTCPLCQLYGRV